MKYDAHKNQLKQWLCFFALVFTTFILAYAQDLILFLLVFFGY